MKEKDVEEKLVAEVKKHGRICPKWVSSGYDGVPDRIVLIPGGHTGFVEVKASGKHPRPLQATRIRTQIDCYKRQIGKLYLSIYGYHEFM